MWTRSQVKDVLLTKKFAIVAASLVAFASGASGGYFLRSKQLEKHYRLVADEEILAAKIFYSKRYKEEEYSDPTTLAQAYFDSSEVEPEEESDNETETQSEMLKKAADILENQEYTSYNQPKQTQEEVAEVAQSVRHNIFDNPAPLDNFEYDEEIEHSKRDAGKPYIISIAEYMSNENGWPQYCVTYYEEDDVVANELDIPMESYEARLGDDNLKFGCGSSDKNIVYIRNENDEDEYEVVRSRGSFAQEVAGLRHSDSPGLRKFRDEY